MEDSPTVREWVSEGSFVLESPELHGTSNWIKLGAYGDSSMFNSNCIVINSNQMMVAYGIFINLEAIGGRSRRAIYLYSITHNDSTIENIYHFDDDITQGGHHRYSLAYNPFRKEIFLFDYNGYIIILDLDSSSRKFKAVSDGICRKVSSVFIDGEYHILIQNESSFVDHFVYDRKNNSLKTLHTFEDIPYHNIVYSKTRQILYAIMQSKTGYPYLWMFDVQNQKWTKAMNKVFRRIKDCGFVITNDERYAIIFTFDMAVYVINLDTMKVQTGEIQGKFTKGGFDAVCCCEYDIPSIGPLISSYLKARFIPKDILHVVERFMGIRQDIHLISRVSREHWKIDLQVLLHSVNTHSPFKELTTDLMHL